MEESRQSKSQKGIYRDPNLQIVFGITLMAVLGVSSITPAFPKIGRELHLSSQAVGWLITVFTFPGVLLAPVLGVLADRWGRKRILVPSLMLFGLAGGACSLARDFNLLLTLRFLQGIGAASLGTLNVTIVGDLYAGKERTTAMGYNASFLSVGAAGYPVIGGALATLGWYYPFTLSLLAVPVGLLVLLGLNSPEPRNEQRFKEYLDRAWESVKNRQAVGLFAAGFGTFIILFGAYLTYLPFLMESAFHVSPFIIGLTMSGRSLTTVLMSSQLGRLTKVCSERTLLKASFALYALALVTIPFAPSLWTLLLPIALFGIAHGMSIPSTQVLLVGLAPMEHRAAFVSLHEMIVWLSQTLGPLLMGAVFGLWGVGGVFYAGAGFSVAMFLLAAILI